VADVAVEVLVHPRPDRALLLRQELAGLVEPELRLPIVAVRSGTVP
jgi:hypothetical protein